MKPWNEKDIAYDYKFFGMQKNFKRECSQKIKRVQSFKASRGEPTVGQLFRRFNCILYKTN